MGENSDIKGYDLTPEDGRLTLFPTDKSKEDAVKALLESPWLKRASSMEHRPCSLGKAYREPVCVNWDADRGALLDFTWRGELHPVDGTQGVWAQKDGWWRDDQGTDKIFVRVLSRGGTYDLSFDRISESWTLEGVAD